MNENGGIAGRDIELIVKDDGYVAVQTIEFIDELIESENGFMTSPWIPEHARCLRHD